MDKAYHLCLAATNKLLAGLLTLMGFSMTSCSTDEEYVTITMKQASKNKE